MTDQIDLIDPVPVDNMPESDVDFSHAQATIDIDDYLRTSFEEGYQRTHGSPLLLPEPDPNNPEFSPQYEAAWMLLALKIIWVALVFASSSHSVPFIAKLLPETFPTWLRFAVAISYFFGGDALISTLGYWLAKNHVREHGPAIGSGVHRRATFAFTLSFTFVLITNFAESIETVLGIRSEIAFWIYAALAAVMPPTLGYLIGEVYARIVLHDRYAEIEAYNRLQEARQAVAVENNRRKTDYALAMQQAWETARQRGDWAKRRRDLLKELQSPSTPIMALAPAPLRKQAAARSGTATERVADFLIGRRDLWNNGIDIDAITAALEAVGLRGGGTLKGMAKYLRYLQNNPNTSSLEELEAGAGVSTTSAKHSSEAWRIWTSLDVASNV